jgi:hypothetical protein
MKECMLEVLLMAISIYERIQGVDDPQTLRLKEWLDEALDGPIL